MCTAGVQGDIEGWVVNGMVLKRRIRDGDRGDGVYRAVEGSWEITGTTSVDVLWRGQVGVRSLGVRSSQTFRKVNAESRLGGLRRELFAGIALDEEAHELLALLLIFRQEVDRFSVSMAMRGVARTHVMNFSEGEERKHGVDDGRDGGERERGD